MPFVFGWIVGHALARIAFSRAVVTLATWYGVAAAGYWLGYSNIGHAAGPYTATAAPLGLLAWALWRPAGSRLRLWLLDGIYLWLRLGTFALAAAVAWRVVASGFMLRQLVAGRRLVAALTAAWSLQCGLTEWVARSHASLDRQG